MSNDLNGKFVTVGQYLGEEMEYVAEDSSKVYEQKGKLYSATNGTVKIDPLKRTVNIIPTQPKKRPEILPNDIVIGRVEFVRKFTVGLQLIKVGPKLLLDTLIYGNIHVSNASKKYVEKLEDAYKKTDLVRARILKKVGMEYEMSTEGNNLGAISADCTICGTTMVRMGRNMVQCPFCGNKEQREMAQDYGDISEKLVL